MNITSFLPNSKRLLTYGLFSVVCHSVGIIFLTTLLSDASPELYFYHFFPMIEHSFVSFVAILIGVLGLEYIDKCCKSQK